MLDKYALIDISPVELQKIGKVLPKSNYYCGGNKRSGFILLGCALTILIIFVI